MLGEIPVWIEYCSVGNPNESNPIGLITLYPLDFL